MKKWWQRSAGDLWLDLFARERTRTAAVVLFLVITLYANAQVIYGGLSGRTYDRFGFPVAAKMSPFSYSAWMTWHITSAVLLDAIVVGAVLFVSRERKKRGRTSAPEPTATIRPSSR